MNKIILAIIFIFCLTFSFADNNEQLTITTYYPSPYGSYNELRTYNNTYLATDGGRVGIGTTAPVARVHIYNPGSATLFIEGTTGQAYSKYSNSNGTAYFGVANNAGIMSGISDGDFVIRPIDGKLHLGSQDVSTPSLTIDNTGNVEIGTVNSGAQLHVIGTRASNAFVVVTNTSTDIGVVIKPGYRTGIASIQGTDSGLTTPASLSINPEGGNVGIGTTNLHVVSPMNNRAGNLDVNDVYINSTGRWVSETTGKYFCIGWCNHRCSDSIAESPRIFSSPTDISGTYASGSRIGCPGGWCREVISCTR